MRIKPHNPRLQTGHLSAPGLVHYFAMNERSGYSIRDLVTGQSAVSTDLGGWEATSVGAGKDIANTSARVMQLDIDSSHRMAGSAEFTIAFVSKGTFIDDASPSISYGSTTASESLVAYPFDNSGGNGERLFFRGDNRITLNDSPSFDDGQAHLFVIVGTAAGADQGLAWWTDGVLRGTGSSSGILGLGTPTWLQVGAWNTQYSQDTIAMAAFWNRALPDQEIATLVVDPFGVVRPRRRLVAKAPVAVAGAPVLPRPSRAFQHMLIR